jgi:serine phosphatase RsbU (regulator of sigma subunit)
VQVVLRNVRRDGTVFSNEITITPLHDDAGVLTHFLALQRDVTAEVAAAASVATLSDENAQIARDLQAGLVPPQLPDAPGLDVAVRFTPAGSDVTSVSGDFYDLYATAGEVGAAATWNAAIGDVEGRGADAAAYTATVRNLLKGLALRPGSPAEALRLLNDALLDQLGDRFVTVALAQLQVRRHRPSPWVVSRSRCW